MTYMIKGVPRLAGLVLMGMLPSSTLSAPVSAPAYDFAAIETQLEKECAAGTFSGVVLVRAQGRDVFEHVCGEADIVNGIANSRETRFKIYSTSKFITGLTIMKLVEMGTMELDAPVATYIPDAPPEWQAVTIRHLLNHTSGIPDLTGQLVTHFRSDHPSAMRATLAALKPEEKALKTEPGATFSYNNFGFELLADAAARAAGKPFAELVDTLVFKPAGMKTASIEAPNMELGHPVAVSEEGLALGYNGEPGKLQQANNWAFIQLGAGAVRATVDDFAALDEALKAGRILSKPSLAEMTKELVPGVGRDAGRAFGLGVFVQEADGVRMEGHTGGTNGYISDFERYRDDDAMLIALTNRGFAKTKWLREGVAKVLKAGR